MNILFINHYAGSPKHGMVYRTYYIARELCKRGHTTTIFSASRVHQRFKQPDCRGTVTVETIDGIRYLWLKTPDYQKNGLVRLLSMLVFCYRLRSKPFDIGKPDVVVVSSPQPFVIWDAARIAGRSGALLIFEERDLWPLTLIELGGFSRFNPVVLAMQYAENWAYKHADRVISLMPKARQHMIANGMRPDKFLYIPNGIDVPEDKQQPKLPKKYVEKFNELKQQGKFLVGYAGAHGLANALHALVKAAGLLKANQKIHFILMGHGPEKERLMEIVRKEKLDNITFLPPVQKTMVAVALNYIDTLYIGLVQKPLFRFGVSPNKLFDYMLAGKPIIYAINSGNDLITESGCGITIKPENPREIVSAVLSFFNMSVEERSLIGERGKQYVKANHDYAILAERFLEAVER